MGKERTPTHLLRKVRTYKAVEDVYLKACERAKSEGTSLTNVIEAFIVNYAANTPVISAKKGKVAPKKKAAKKFSDTITEIGLEVLALGSKKKTVRQKAKPQLQDYEE
jgi:hypothetical protein